MITSKRGVNTLYIKEIPVPPKTIMVTFEKEIGPHISRNELFFDHGEFLQFFGPLAQYYEELKNANSIQK